MSEGQDVLERALSVEMAEFRAGIAARTVFARDAWDRAMAGLRDEAQQAREAAAEVAKQERGGNERKRGV